MTNARRVSIEEYSQTSYRPDVEYLDGILKAKPESGIEHGRTEALLGVWFYEHRREWQVNCALNTRTQVSPVCMRLVDVVVFNAANREREQLITPPLVAIEVLSAADAYMDLKARFSDLEVMGVQNIWLVDPETRTGQIWQQGGWYVAKDGRLQAADSTMFLDLHWIGSSWTSKENYYNAEEVQGRVSLEVAALRRPDRVRSLLVNHSCEWWYE